MSPEEKEQIKLEIEKKIKITLQNIESLKDQVKPVAPDEAIGRITRMDAIQQKSVCEAALRTAEESLVKLKKALSKLDNPNFAICIKCKGTIPLGRVLAIPETTLCVKCAN